MAQIHITFNDSTTRSIHCQNGGVTKDTIADALGDRDKNTITSVSIDQGVTSIEEYAFYGCTGLTSITIPDGVTSIERGLFYGCTGLKSITIPEGVTAIGDSAFYGCKSLSSITIPDGVTSISWRAFHSCSGLTNITCIMGQWEEIKNTIKDTIKTIHITSYVTWIRDWAIYDCSGLTKHTIPNSVTSIRGGVFRGCMRLKSITIPDGVTAIRGFAFNGCSNLQSIKIPPSVTAIENGAFYDCKGLTSITIPGNVTSISLYAFEGCSGLTTITIPDGVTSIGISAFRDCSGLQSIEIPPSVISIGNGAFRGCSNLRTIQCTQTQLDSYPAIFPQGTILLDHNWEVLRLPQGMTKALTKPSHFSKMTHDAKMLFYVTNLMQDEWTQKTVKDKIDFIIQHYPDLTASELHQFDRKLYKQFTQADEVSQLILNWLPLTDIQSLSQVMCDNLEYPIDLHDWYKRCMDGARFKNRLSHSTLSTAKNCYVFFQDLNKLSHSIAINQFSKHEIENSPGYKQYIGLQLMASSNLFNDWCQKLESSISCSRLHADQPVCDTVSQNHHLYEKLILLWIAITVLCKDRKGTTDDVSPAPASESERRDETKRHLGFTGPCGQAAG